MATVVDGRKIAGEIIEDLKKEPVRGKFLGIVISQENQSLNKFLKRQIKTAKKLKVKTFNCFHIEDLVSGQENLTKQISELCEYEAVGGITLQLPLPKCYNLDRVVEMIDPRKDINCLNKWNDYVVSPSVLALERILRTLNYEITDKKVVILGEGFLVGQPIKKYLCQKAAKLTVFRSNNDLFGSFESSILKEADLIITATGKRGLISAKMLKPGAGVIDFGNGDLSLNDGKSPNELSFYTPPVGGTGPILVSCLFENFYRLTELQNQFQ